MSKKGEKKYTAARLIGLNKMKKLRAFVYASCSKSSHNRRYKCVYPTEVNSWRSTNILDIIQYKSTLFKA